MSEVLEQEERRQKRPVFLTVIGILSLINIGWSLLTNFFSLIGGPMNEEELEEAKIEMTKSINQVRGTEGMEWFEDFMRSIIDMMESTNTHHTMNVLTGILILLIGLVGVIFMLKGRKLGFHIYIVYSFLAAVQIYLFIAPSLLSNMIVIISLFLSGIFVLLYGLNLKWMK
ncbi:hypothetical protein H9Y05_10440 [Crocinitomicaceae bacterium CZZ-1]|uniref:Uncharacterized protein n=1 Tax=Taishania pollutisoli TaxID=2766479 RepID=A0A8J6PQJ8_9FLAO|nr:hypothetical protein [Taishania pollutisoli]MBC9812888.1 hypothetical protein [Taishania pollutisoli]MBX2949663.1 hypothetical protein [Crocinitomicaceae bacterium]NGF76847.1 hypothetical protein [Fluviicola sp. SGL-29]